MGQQSPQQMACQSSAALKGWLLDPQQVCLLLFQGLTSLLYRSVTRLLCSPCLAEFAQPSSAVPRGWLLAPSPDVALSPLLPAWGSTASMLQPDSNCLDTAVHSKGCCQHSSLTFSAIVSGAAYVLAPVRKGHLLTVGSTGWILCVSFAFLCG